MGSLVEGVDEGEDEAVDKVGDVEGGRDETGEVFGDVDARLRKDKTKTIDDTDGISGLETLDVETDAVRVEAKDLADEGGELLRDLLGDVFRVFALQEHVVVGRAERKHLSQEVLSELLQEEGDLSGCRFL